MDGAQALADDPYLQKNYSVDQAIQIWYAQADQLADALRRTDGVTKPGQSDGRIMADVLQLTGDSAADFAAKFDSKSLQITDAATLGFGMKEDRYWIKNAAGGVIGEGLDVSVADGVGLADWERANPRSAWCDGQGHQGGGGLMVTW